MLSGIASLFTPRSKPNQPPPPASDASRNALPLPEASQPLVTPIQQEEANSDAEDEGEEEDTPQPKLVDAKNYESPTIAKARRLSDEHARPTTRDGPTPLADGAAPAARDPKSTRANTEKARRSSQTRSTARSTRETWATAVKPANTAAVPGNGVSTPRLNGRKRRREVASGPPAEKPKRRRRKSAQGPLQDAAAIDDELPPYEASATVDGLYHYSTHVDPSTPSITPWRQLPRTRHVEQDGNTYHERDAVHIEVGDGENMEEEAMGLILEIRGELALVAWYYTPDDAKARKRPTAWAKNGKTHIISSHVDVISVEAFYDPPLSARQRSHLVEDKVLNLADPNGRTPRLTDHIKACVLAWALR
ncbi:hypothetical protein BDV96DRAFT_642291 [Lophiotrema nucula]|uniref:BAH domain-containing protein n=1 Tax=Lophiotrema nucula TaxID=690887 RepID=A0A6A5ZJE8_9PLEO|nr:hypothetical protein BDV96DRAFT_642291 [Lophiotrema nucula]